MEIFMGFFFYETFPTHYIIYRKYYKLFIYLFFFFSPIFVKSPASPVSRHSCDDQHSHRTNTLANIDSPVS